jgi:membrane-associated phospholipid phosphatase
MHLDQMPGLHIVAGVDFHSHFSFPSGHSAAAFSMCLALAVIIGRFATAMVLALTASLLAFSRVYLSQHFTEDIVAGALVGSVAAAAIYYLLYQSPLSQRAALDRAPFGTRG